MIIFTPFTFLYFRFLGLLSHVAFNNLSCLSSLEMRFNDCLFDSLLFEPLDEGLFMYFEGTWTTTIEQSMNPGDCEFLWTFDIILEETTVDVCYDEVFEVWRQFDYDFLVIRVRKVVLCRLDTFLQHFYTCLKVVRRSFRLCQNIFHRLALLLNLFDNVIFNRFTKKKFSILQTGWVAKTVQFIIFLLWVVIS